METELLVAVGILAVIALGVTMLLATAHGRTTTGRLTRETRNRDREAAMTMAAANVSIARSSDAVTENPRARADEARRALMPRPTVPEPAGERAVTVWQPADLEELGITRRQFFNRSLLAGLGLGIGAFGVASLAFLWPSASGGFGGKVQVGSVSDVQSAFDKKAPYYNAAARAYLVPYPKADLAKARKVPAYTPPILAGMALGYVALYQKCPHLGCRVPWCQTSQWFECPCHGSKYNRVGEKRGGPAPRGMDRFPFTISSGNLTVDTGIIVLGPPIGTDTTTQSPEGPLCV